MRNPCHDGVPMLNRLSGLVLWANRKMTNLSTYDKLLFFLTACITLSLKLFFSRSEPSELTWMLFPTTKIVEAFTGISFLYDSESGYRNLDAAIVIGKSCAGINYFIITLCMSVFSFMTSFKKRKLLIFAVFVVAAYAVTVAVNAFRIIGGIALVNIGEHFRVAITDSIHEAEGIMVSFFYLVLYYSAVQALVDAKGKQNERVR